MAEEICPIRPIHLRGQLEHLKGNIIPCQRNIAKFGTKQTFLISSHSGIGSVDLGGAGHVFCFLRSKLGRLRQRTGLLELGHQRREQRRIGPPAAKPQAFTHCLSRGSPCERLLQPRQ
jgi:hypothetical protein